MKSYPRQEKIAELLHFQIANLMRRECRGQYLNENVSISDIRVSRGGFDCSVYLSSFKGRPYLDKAVAEANDSAGRMRSYLGKRLRMKKIPPIKFSADEVLEQGARIDRLLEEDSARSSGGTAAARGLAGEGAKACDGSRAEAERPAERPARASSEADGLADSEDPGDPSCESAEHPAERSARASSSSSSEADGPASGESASVHGVSVDGKGADGHDPTRGPAELSAERPVLSGKPAETETRG